MALYASWVHGNSAVPQYQPGGDVFLPGMLETVNGIPNTSIGGLAQGPGKVFRGRANTQSWFHFSIPTPVLTNDIRAKLDWVFVLFKLHEREARVKQVVVFDGPILVKSFTTNIAGDRSDSIYWPGSGMDSNAFHIDFNYDILWGIGVSVLVDFGNKVGDVTFTTAGANFII